LPNLCDILAQLLYNLIVIIAYYPHWAIASCAGLALSQLVAQWGFYILHKESAKMTTKWCYKCETTKPLSEFGKDRGRKDGLAIPCKKCRKEDGRKYRQSNLGKTNYKKFLKKYKQTERGKRLISENIKRFKKKNPEKPKAYDAVKYAIQSGKLPRVSTQTCTDCGEQAEHYHHESYDKKDRLNVVSLCALCHKQRHK
jgi:hypothetical protein